MITTQYESLTQALFWRYFVAGDLAASIKADLKISRNEFTRLTEGIAIEKAEEIKEMRRIRQLYNNKRKVKEDLLFEFKDFTEFYTWYLKQYSEQAGCCYYCETKEKVIAELFRSKFTSKRSMYRGQHLEVERKESTTNKYNKENCVLACYFCNNDKSDIFSVDEYLEYLKGKKAFFDKQYKAMK